MHFGSRGVEDVGDYGTRPGGHPVSSTDVHGKTPGGSGVGL